MEEPVYEEDPPEPPIHTKEELVRALFRADQLIEGRFTGSIAARLRGMNGLMAQHARFMREGEHYEDFIKVREKIEVEEAIG